MDGGKSAVRWLADTLAPADRRCRRPLAQAEFSAQRLRRSRLQSTRPCDCEKEQTERQWSDFRVISVGFCRSAISQLPRCIDAEIRVEQFGARQSRMIKQRVQPGCRSPYAALQSRSAWSKAPQRH